MEDIKKFLKTCSFVCDVCSPDSWAKIEKIPQLGLKEGDVMGKCIEFAGKKGDVEEHIKKLEANGGKIFRNNINE